MSKADLFLMHLRRANRDLFLHTSAFARPADLMNAKYHLRQALSIAGALKDRHAISSVLRVMSWLRTWEAREHRLFTRHIRAA